MTVALDEYLDALDSWWRSTSGRPMDHATRQAAERSWRQSTDERRMEFVRQLHGGRAPLSLVTESPSDPSSPLERIRAAAVSTDALKALPPAQPLVQGLLDLDSLAIIYGASGSSKSFLSIDVALHVATGSWWNRCEIAAGPVVYVAAEGARGIGRRVDAWQTQHQVYDLGRHHPITWVTMPVNLHNAAWAGAFADYCVEQRPVLVVVDTLARCAAGADENSAKDMGVLIDNLDRVKRLTGACTVAVHHTGKDAGAGARGSSALRAAVDTEIEVSASDELVTVKVTKQKDHDEARPWRFVRTPLADSCVLMPDRGQNGAGTNRSHQQALDALAEIAVPGGVSTATWRDAATASDRPDGIGRSTFYGAVRALLDGGLVQNLGTDRSPRYAPVLPGQGGAA